jgi:hypothetical protein
LPESRAHFVTTVTRAIATNPPVTSG